jgi:D-alanyl-D-alanine carboxypeptidase/D-alanyl-D-alanine-endopeptidase (penicillin-binding protein 4)
MRASRIMNAMKFGKSSRAVRKAAFSCALVCAFGSAAGFVSVASAGAQQTAVSKKKTAASATTARAGVKRADVARFETRVNEALADVHAQKGEWGILVVDRDTGATVYELNADKSFTPASNAKVITTSFAFATLGPEYKFKTTLETTAKMDGDGKLGGDLVLVGRGDPNLSNRVFPFAGKVEHDGPVEKILYEMADAAIARGVKEVDGNVVADDSYYPFDPYPAGWAVGDLFFTYGAPVSALSFNDNSFEMEVSPGANPGDPAVIAVQPAAAMEAFSEIITTVTALDKPDFSVTRGPGSDFIHLRGQIPQRHASVKLDFAMTDSAQVTAAALKQVLEGRGIRVTGTAVARHAPPPLIYNGQDAVLGPAPLPPSPDTNVLAEHLSPTLLETTRLTNKVSQNLHAELLLRAVAHEKKGFGVTDAGIWAENDFLASIGVADGDVLLEDGSGLSGNDLVTPRAMVQVLRYDAQQPWGEAYASTLPVAGIDGTLEGRMKKTTAEGLIQAKTGSLERVHSLSGYATTLRGEKLVFSIFANNNSQPGRDSTNAIDEIGVAMVETLGAALAPRTAAKGGSKGAGTKPPKKSSQ